jgi:16S rRNA (adenine1518-N6/adenine1519-N6)-dimethyltransferase
MRWTHLGQHFLANRNAAEKMVKAFLPVNGPILEIGPGKGILTGILSKYCPANKIAAVELDTALYHELKIKFDETVELFNQNILHIDPGELFPGENEAVNVIGNVPYYISKELVDWVITQREKLTRGMFMMQKEFVDRLMAGKGSRHANARAILFNGLFRVEKLFDLQPGSFSPPPRVKSTLFMFERSNRGIGQEIDVDDFYGFLQGCFSRRRKTLVNSLAPSPGTERLVERLNSLGIDPRARAEQLGLEDFLQVYRFTGGTRD